MIFTASLVAQNTSVYLCDIVKPRIYDKWLATVLANGTFGGGTVTLSISVDGGTTKHPITQDGVNTAASLTALGGVNISSGYTGNNLTTAKLYASIATATNPSVNLIVLDNR